MVASIAAVALSIGNFIAYQMESPPRAYSGPLAWACGILVCILLVLVVMGAVRAPSPVFSVAAWVSLVITVFGFYVVEAAEWVAYHSFLANASIWEVGVFDNQVQAWGFGAACAAGFACGVFGLFGHKKNGRVPTLLPAIFGLLLSGSIGLLLLLLILFPPGS
jgi:hypothetical protein